MTAVLNPYEIEWRTVIDIETFQTGGESSYA